MSIQHELFTVQSYDVSQPGEYIDQDRLKDKLNLIFLGADQLGINALGNAILIGPTGSGKDHCLNSWSIDANAIVYKTQCYQNMNEMDLLGYPQAIGDKFVFVHGILPSACIAGQQNPDRIVLINITEANLASAGVLPVLNPLADFTRSINIPFTGETIKRPDNVKLALTMNPWNQAGYAGTNQLNIAMLNRFAILRTDYLREDLEKKLLLNFNSDYNTVAKWVAFANKTRNAYKEQNQLSNVITTRNLIWYVQYIKALEEHDVLRMAFNQFLDTEEADLRLLWGEVEQGK